MLPPWWESAHQSSSSERGDGWYPKGMSGASSRSGTDCGGANSRGPLLGQRATTIATGRFLGPGPLQGLALHASGRELWSPHPHIRTLPRRPPQPPLLASQGSTEHSLPESPAMCSLPVTHDQGGGLTSSDLIR